MMLTDVAINNAKPGAKAVRLFDGKGLYLEVSPAGGKWWRFKYRFAGKEKRLSLGVYPSVDLEMARKRLTTARQLLDDGVDPSASRKAMKAVRQRQAQQSTPLGVRSVKAELRLAADGQTRRSARLLIEAADEIERLERELDASAGADRCSGTR